MAKDMPKSKKNPRAPVLKQDFVSADFVYAAIEG
jgi:hypothetical protein